MEPIRIPATAIDPAHREYGHAYVHTVDLVDEGIGPLNVGDIVEFPDEGGIPTRAVVASLEDQNPGILYELRLLVPPTDDLVTLSPWQVRELPDGARHFVGFSLTDLAGRVSSPIKTWDPDTQTGTTGSGRQYFLEDRPDGNAEAEVVWSDFCRNRDVNPYDFVDASGEFWLSAYRPVIPYPIKANWDSRGRLVEHTDRNGVPLKDTAGATEPNAEIDGAIQKRAEDISPEEVLALLKARREPGATPDGLTAAIAPEEGQYVVGLNAEGDIVRYFPDGTEEPG